ncbi:hypothetical protein K440DRAFT_633003 [Wilcoxina mikolae CBS 423.85]|nr:hypothetical protein K440DRAFT_633003 [Wilcoxina mikolae CBS 423.85]
MSKSFEIGDDYQDGRSLALSRAMSFATIDYNRPEVVWNEEKEQQLTNLEKRLVRANRNWSDEQEDVLPLVESLREERRKAKKLAVGEESPRKIRGGSFSFVGRRDSRARRDSGGEEKKERVRRGSAGDENRAKSGLMRFFSKREAA